MTHETAARIALFGGLTAAAGAFLPWVTFGLFNASLISASYQQGVIVAVAGGIAAVGALTHLDKPVPSVGRLAIITGGVIPLAIGLNGMAGASASIGGVAITTSPGIGLLAVIGGGVAATLGGLRMDAIDETEKLGVHLDGPPSESPSDGVNIGERDV